MADNDAIAAAADEIDRLRSTVAERDAECHRLRAALAQHFAGEWYLTRWSDLTHVEDCECEAADGHTIDPDTQDPRCAESADFPVLVLDNGAYVGWALRLDTLHTLLNMAWEDGIEDDEIAPLVAAFVWPGVAELQERLDAIALIHQDEVLFDVQRCDTCKGFVWPCATRRLATGEPE